MDLGKGREWLSSRLFVFAEMLPRLRSLRCFVFVEGGAIRGRLVGIARPEAVRWALAQRYPWLELALEQAYASQGPQYLQQNMVQSQNPISSTGAVPPVFAQQIGHAFLQAIQEPAPSEVTPAPPSPSPETDGWVLVPDELLGNQREHATWLDGAAVEELLGASLQHDAWVNENRFASDEEHARAVLRRQGDFVAIVRGDMTFRRLVDRRLLIEELVTRQLRE